MATVNAMNCFTNLFDLHDGVDDRFNTLTDLFVDEESRRGFIDLWTPARGSDIATPTSPFPPYGVKASLSATSLDHEYHRSSHNKSERTFEEKVVRYRVRSCELLERLRYPATSDEWAGRRIECFLIHQQNSNSRLLVSRSLFDAWSYQWGVFEHVQDHLMSFGFKVRENDIGPARCKVRTYEPEGPHSLCESGEASQNCSLMECVYGLRYVEQSGSSKPNDEWRVRQSAIYQKTDPGNNQETWLFVSASPRMQKCIHKYLNAADSTKPPKPINLHLALITIAAKDWRWYIKSLVAKVTEQTSRVVAAPIDEESENPLLDFRISFEDRQVLKVIEDKILDLVIIFDSMQDTLRELCCQWTGLDPSNPKSRSPSNTFMILRDNIAEVGLHRRKAQSLLTRLSGTTSLLSNLLDTQVGRSLQTLAEESRTENKIIRQLTEKSTKDAAAVKAITVITIIYLPTSVVASFFSTQFVYRSNEADGKPSLQLAEDWWLSAAISVPLTVTTIAIWYMWISWPWTVFKRLQGLSEMREHTVRSSLSKKAAYLQRANPLSFSKSRGVIQDLNGTRTSRLLHEENRTAPLDRNYNCV